MKAPYSRINARRRACAAGGVPARHWRIRHIFESSGQVEWAVARVRQRMGGGRWSGVLIPLPLLVIVLLLTGWSALGAASSNAHPLAARQQLASGPRTIARWIDPTDGTALLLALLEAPNQPPGAVTFTLPSGDELRALKVGSPLLVLARQLSQLSADAPFDVSITVCGPATLLSAQSIAAAAIAQPVAMVLGIHVGQGGLLAYAGLNYAALSQTAFAASACVLTSPQYEMKAGCSDLTSPCAPLPTPVQAVAQYNQAVVGAAQSGDWNGVWVRTSQAVTAQYPSGTFGAQMNQQVQRVGRITNVVPSGASPTVQFSAAGEAYFISQDAITLDHNGSTKQLLVTSYYLLEGGSWKFWFSCQPGQC